jgi:CRISPR-associated protein Cmr4
MIDAAECFFLYLESSLRVGSGEESEKADLPVQREVATGYPLLPASSLKGALRGRARSQQATPEMIALLGSEPESEERQAGAVVVSDAYPLLFPVRSLAGLFAWITSREIWSRFQRDLAAYGVKVAGVPQLPALAPETAGVAPETPFLTGKNTLVLEEMSFPAQAVEQVGGLGAWLADQAFPDEPAFDYWRQRVARGVVVLPEAGYRHFLDHATQVVPRIRIDPRTGTAADGSLWTEEYLPPETLLVGLVGARLPQEPAGGKRPAVLAGKIKTPADAIEWVKGLAPTYLQLGSGKTLGHGIVRVRWTGKKRAAARGGRKAKKS